MRQETLTMSTATLATLVIMAAVPALVALVARIKRTKHIFATDHQKGVRFSKGAFRDVLGAGCYVIDTVKEQIVVMDLRPLALEHHGRFTDTLNVSGWQVDVRGCARPSD